MTKEELIIERQKFQQALDHSKRKFLSIEAIVYQAMEEDINELWKLMIAAGWDGKQDMIQFYTGYITNLHKGIEEHIADIDKKIEELGDNE